jgi:hypothetical protein
MNVKIAAKLLYASDHPWDANPQAELLPVLASGGFLSSLPVIADDQTQSLAHTSEGDGDARRGGVAIHVGQCLLNDAEQCLLER